MPIGNKKDFGGSMERQNLYIICHWLEVLLHISFPACWRITQIIFLILCCISNQRLKEMMLENDERELLEKSARKYFLTAAYYVRDRKSVV